MPGGIDKVTLDPTVEHCYPLLQHSSIITSKVIISQINIEGYRSYLAKNHDIKGCTTSIINFITNSDSFHTLENHICYGIFQIGRDNHWIVIMSKH